MSRISEVFAKLASGSALIPYITAGDPHPGLTVEMMHMLVQSGADIIELGVPFSDPMADGPVIQKASERALLHDVGLGDVLEMVREFRRRDSSTPVVLMGYLNPIEVMGYAQFAEAAAAAGVDGVLTVDMPPEEAGDLMPLLDKYQLEPIFLIAPTTSMDRIRTICAAAKGYVYYVSVKGVTGASTLDVASVAEKVEKIRQCTQLPVGVGFGIKDATSAAQIAQIADGVVVGSAIIKLVENFSEQKDKMLQAIAALLKDMRQAMDQRM
ncbi:MAG: tryptophan synthase subunit alpha [Gammaproteobacteria bacterium]|nr:tryptophan synthase subunit alpha [Gammaproteobacteria bacterium]MDH5800946.1 tryptophan synthase subunit alpha [Gammaproteobacteria bacterium]